ncbi:MAG: PAS domain-containing protein, partial [Desulfobacteraceae bacterium]|nr:PAS domain-containing protein [Desulfobacteraceae bacterium]
MKDEDKTKEQLINELAKLRRVVELETSENRSRQREENLRETRDYLEKLLHYANSPIIVWDPEFRITRFNQAFVHLTSLTAEEVIGKKIHILFPEATRDESMSKITSTLSGEYWESVEIPILRKDGDNRIALWNSANIYAEDG